MSIVPVHGPAHPKPLVRSFGPHLRALNRSEGTVETYFIGLRQADASDHGTTQDAATRADLEAFRVMPGRSHGIDRMAVVGHGSRAISSAPTMLRCPPRGRGCAPAAGRPCGLHEPRRRLLRQSGMSANPDRVPTDAVLLAAVAEGDPEAFGALYDQHAPWLLMRLRQRTTNQDLADQVAQETLPGGVARGRALPWPG